MTLCRMPNARCFDVIVRCIIAEHNSIRPCGNERRPTMKWEYHFFVVATGQSLVESSINELGKVRLGIGDNLHEPEWCYLFRI
jgi:hypothetical protein